MFLGTKKTKFDMTIIIILLVAVIIYLFSKSNNSSSSQQQPKKTTPKSDEVEGLNEKEFIAFVRNNYGDYNKYFKYEGAGGNRMLSACWSTSKYRIRSVYDDDNLNDFITVIRKSDNKEIDNFCYGPLDEDDYNEY
jgi:hypothetical protein